MSAPKKVMLSAVQPTNPMTLGNFVGAMRNWTRFQKDYDSIFFAVDQHAITLRQDPALLRENTLRLMATFIAAGLDPEHCTLFIQSHVPEHTELGWILVCNSTMGELNRMTQFKDKSQKQGTHIPAGLFVYPTLMAADILLYQAELIPVGDDQKQHVELTRDLALRMNQSYGQPLFTVPEPFIPKVGARIMSLQDPTKKMSKSDPDPKATIYLTDSNKQIQQKIKSAVTDSGSDVVYTTDKPGIKNLLDIQAALLGEDPQGLVERYVGKMYGHLKQDTADVVVAAIGPVRDAADTLLKDPAELERLLARGAQKARARAQLSLEKVRRAVGFVPRGTPA